MKTWTGILIATWAAGSALGADEPVAQLDIVALEGGRDAVISFAHGFKPGDLKGSLALTVNGKRLWTQAEVKRRFKDGSIKHALISAVWPGAVNAGQRFKGSLIRAGADDGGSGSPDQLPRGLNVDVTFVYPDNSTYSADLGATFKAAMGGKALPYVGFKWREGPVVTEFRVAGPPLDKEGKPDPDLWVVYGVKVFGKGDAAQVEIVVENCWHDSPGNVPYDVVIRMGGKKVYSLSNIGQYEGKKYPYWLTSTHNGDPDLGHYRQTRWRKVFSWGRSIPAMEVKPDPAYLVETGLLPPYQTSLAIDRKGIERNIAGWSEAARDILDPGIITTYFPMTGGREDIGPYPTWTTRYLLSGNSELRKIVLGTGELGAGFPVHMRDRKSGRLFTVDDHPGYSLNPRGTFEKIAPRKAEGRTFLKPPGAPYRVDCAHQPSLAFVPYLVTGDYFFLEEMYFWANWCMLTQNAQYRQKGKGLIVADQTRGEAWALRQLVDAAKMAPDDHPEKEYFTRMVRNNLEWYNKFINGPSATPLGTYTLGGGESFVRGRPPPERQRWCTLAPWQQNFLVWSFDHAVRAGFDEAAAPRDHLAGLQVGMLTEPDFSNPKYAAPYFLVVGERKDRTEPYRYYTTWRDLFDKTFKTVAPPAQGKEPRLASNYGGSYSYIARAVLIIAQQAGLKNADKALAALERELGDMEKTLAYDPTWAFKRDER